MVCSNRGAPADKDAKGTTQHGGGHGLALTFDHGVGALPESAAGAVFAGDCRYSRHDEAREEGKEGGGRCLREVRRRASVRGAKEGG